VGCRFEPCVGFHYYGRLAELAYALVLGTSLSRFESGVGYQS
jgi:hypothetical protein